MASQFVKLPVTGSGGGGGSGVTSFNGRSGVVVSQAGDYSGALITNTPAGSISATNVQAAINELDSEKQELITGAATTITNLNLSIDRALISNGLGKVAASTVTATELSRLIGVTSNIQTQLNAKEPTITVLPIAKGGTGASTATGAVQNLGINITHSFNNVNYTVPNTYALNILVRQTGTLTGNRVVTLPNATSMSNGTVVTVVDQSGTAGLSTQIIVSAASGQTINGNLSATHEITKPYNSISFTCDGVSGWYASVVEVGDGGTGITTAPTNGQLLVGDTTAGGYSLNTLAAGAGISIVNGPGTIQVVNTAVAAFINIDGGRANTVYGGMSPIDGGNSI